MESSYSDLRSKVEYVFFERQKRNPRYSLRAFARDLNLDPAMLSRFITGQRKLAQTSVKRILTHVPAHEWPGGTAPPKSLYQFRKLSFEEYLEVSEPLGWVITTMTALKHFKSNVEWLAQELGEPIDEIRRVVQKFFKAGWLVQDPSGKWLDRAGATVDPGYENKPQSIRKQGLEYVQKIDTRSLEEHHPSRHAELAYVPIQKRDLKAAKQALDDFRIEFIQKFGREANADELVVLYTGLFPVGKKPT